MKKKYFLIGGVLLFLLIIFGYDWYVGAGDVLEEEKDLVALQSNIESEFTSDGYSLESPKVILNPYEISPLTALVIFETDEELSVKVTIHGKDELTTFTHEFGASKEHYIPIYGLYADYENKVTIECGDKKKVIKIKTDKLPDDFILPTSVKKNENKLTNDLYFFTPSSQGYTCAYDVNGDVRWYLTTMSLWKIDRLSNGHLLISTDKLVNNPYYTSGMYEMNLLGKIFVEYSIEGGYHHDYYEMENGNLLVSSDDFGNEDGTVEDYIVELDRKSGEVVKTFDLKDILNMEDGKSENWTAYDWFHNNSVWYDKNTNSITLSGRHQDAVINIDYDTGKLNWIIGDPTNWSEEYQKYFFTPVGDNFEWQWSQHAAMITPEGYVFILDNGNNKSKVKEEYVPANESYTRGVMYKIDTDKMTIEQVWEYGKERGSDYYSPYISDVDYIAKNHYIVHSGGISYKDGEVLNVPAGIGGADELKSITTELLNDDVIFEITLPTNNYRVEKMSLYYENEEYEFGNAKRLGSLGKTEYTNSFKPLLFAKDINENYEIELTKEVDRLVISGRFLKGTIVNVILYNNFNSKQYDLIVSKRPYTALCVDILSDEENENGIKVTKYINNEGLKGKYAIYLEIDGTLYKTNNVVDFN